MCGEAPSQTRKTNIAVARLHAVPDLVTGEAASRSQAAVWDQPCRLTVRTNARKNWMLVGRWR
jgi:hypothetical protein